MLYNFAFPPTIPYSICFPRVLLKKTMGFAFLIGWKWFHIELKFMRAV